MPTFDMGPVPATFQATQNASNNQREPNFEGYRMSVLKEFIKLKPPAFEGESDPLAAEIWLKTVKTMFDTVGVLSEYWVEFATYLFEGSAEEWWDSKGDDFDLENLKWEEFETLFRETYVPETLRQDMIAELGRLVQRNMTIAQYQACFINLSTYDPLMVADPVSRCVKFRKGLNSNIRQRLEPFTFTNFNELVNAAQSVESYLERKHMGRIKKIEMKDKTQVRCSQGKVTNTSSGRIKKIDMKGKMWGWHPQFKVTNMSNRKIRSNSCLFCRQLGHKILECPFRQSESFLADGGQLQGQSGSNDSGSAPTQTCICYECGQVGHVKRTCPFKQSPSTLVEPLRDPSNSSAGGQLQGQSGSNDSANVKSQTCICHKCGQVGHFRRNCPLEQSPSTLSAAEPLRDPSSSSVVRQLQGQSGTNDSGNAKSQTNTCHNCGQVGHYRRNCPLEQLPFSLFAAKPLSDPSSSSFRGQLQGQSGSNDLGNAKSQTCTCHNCGQVGHFRRNCPLEQSPSMPSAMEPLRDPSSSFLGGQLQGQFGSNDLGNAKSQTCTCHNCGQVGHFRRNCPLEHSPSMPSAMEPLRDPSSSSFGGQLQGQFGSNDFGNARSQTCTCHKCGQVGHVRRNCPLEHSPSTPSAMEPLRDPSSSSFGGQLQGQFGSSDFGNARSQTCICHKCGQVGHVRRNCPLEHSLSTPAAKPLTDPSSSSFGVQLQGQSGSNASSNAKSQTCICHKCGQVGHIRRNCPLEHSPSTPSAAKPLRDQSSSPASGSRRFMPYPQHAFTQIGREMSRRQAKKLRGNSQHSVQKKLRGQSGSASSELK